MRIIAFIVLAACAPSAAEMARDNTAAKQRATQRAGANITAFTPAPVSVAEQDDDVREPDTLTAHALHLPDAGFRGDEHLATLDDGRVVMIGGQCVQTARCSNDCTEYATYTFGTSGDHVVISRMRPVYTSVATDRDSSCSGTCGGNPPSPARPVAKVGLVLGRVQAVRVEVRDVPYTVEYRNHVCTNMTPVP